MEERLRSQPYPIRSVECYLVRSESPASPFRHSQRGLLLCPVHKLAELSPARNRLSSFVSYFLLDADSRDRLKGWGGDTDAPVFGVNVQTQGDARQRGVHSTSV